MFLCLAKFIDLHIKLNILLRHSMIGILLFFYHIGESKSQGAATGCPGASPSQTAMNIGISDSKLLLFCAVT